MTSETNHTNELDQSTNPLREFALARMDDFWLRGLRMLAQYRGDRNMALDAFILAIGKGELIGCQTAVEVAVKHYANPKKKAAVTKTVKLFQDCLGVDPMPGQRGQEGRTKMAQARKNQLK